MLATLANAWKIPELRKRIIYTLMMFLVFRLGSSIPVPGINNALLDQLFQNDAGFLSFFNLMSGGSFKRFTIFALGIAPYITASIIMNLLQIALPYFENLAKEGDAGRKKMVQYTRYGTVVLSLIQAIGITLGLFKPAFTNFGLVSASVAVIVLTAGTAFLMYLGEKITENGIGNGISLFIFAGILSGVPVAVGTMIQQMKEGTLNVVSVIIFCVLAVLIIAGVVFMTQGSRKIPVQYAKRQVGRKMYGGHSTHIPLKVNMAGVIPVIFAISLLMFPQTIAQFWPQSGFYAFMNQWFNNDDILWNLLYALLIIGFTYFYTSVTFNPAEVAENMKKNGGFIPGIRPGKPTSDYLIKVLNRLTLAGASFLALIAVLPNAILAIPAFSGLQMSFGGTSLLIAVGVSMDTMKQIEAQMVMRHYQGFLK